MTMPRYIVWCSSRQFYLCERLAEALDWRSQTGGLIYEPLAATAAELIAAKPLDEPEPETDLDDFSPMFDDPGGIVPE